MRPGFPGLLLGFHIGLAIMGFYFIHRGEYGYWGFTFCIILLSTMLQILYLRRKVNQQIQVEREYIAYAVQYMIDQCDQATIEATRRIGLDNGTRAEMRLLQGEVTQAVSEERW